MRVTTDATLRRDLRASLNAREGVPAGQTWGSFKWAMAQLGVRDDDVLASIEFTGGSGVIVREDSTHGIDIKETR